MFYIAHANGALPRTLRGRGAQAPTGRHPLPLIPAKAGSLALLGYLCVYYHHFLVSPENGKLVSAPLEAEPTRAAYLA